MRIIGNKLRLVIGLVAAASVASIASPCFAAERVALVIGNNAYRAVNPLNNCINDARAVAKTLKEVGFEVTLVEDASLEQMEAKVLEFRRAAQGAKAAWFFYSGHGAEVKGTNYLVPVDAEVKEEFQIKSKAFALDQLMGAMEEAGTPLKVVVLDCCRSNPFGKGWSRAGTQGLGQVGETPKGTIIAFATAPGKVASDGSGKNSPFTTALIATMAKRDLEIDQVFKETGRAVLAATADEQQPWINSSFFDSFVVRPGAGGATAVSSQLQLSDQPQRETATGEQLLRNATAAYIASGNLPTLDGEMEFYAERVDYYGKGFKTQAEIRTDLTKERQKWTSRNYKILRITQTQFDANKDSGVAIVRFSYAVSNGSKQKTGEAATLVEFRSLSDSPKLIRVQEQKTP